MELGFFTEILGVVFGGSLGAILMQLYTAKINKEKLKKEVEEAEAEIERKRLETKQDAFDTVYAQLTKCLNDYNTISDEYHAHREKVRKYEEAVQEKIRRKCDELAELKAKVTYFRGLRCYNTICPNRVRTNPDKNHQEASSKNKKQSDQDDQD